MFIPKQVQICVPDDMLLNVLCVNHVGRVCVPIDINRLEDFNPFEVPTIRFEYITIVSRSQTAIFLLAFGREK